MSGGVDSSVAAYLLKEDGWDVLGITMKIPVSCNTNNRSCCGADAAFVCNELNIPHYFIDVTRAFQQLIIDPFRKSYAKGQTPNPCVDCNTLLKFSLVWDFLEKTFGISYLATGHYARIVWSGKGQDQGPELFCLWNSQRKAGQVCASFGPINKKPGSLNRGRTEFKHC
jgi:tRNA-specific 2-thiouridylase